MPEKTKSPVSFWIPLLLSWLFVGLLWWFAPLIVNTQIPVSTSGDSTGMTAGTFGDQFGFINALFSGLALATIAISLWYQRHDIQIQQAAILDQKNVFEKQLRIAAKKEIMDSLPVVHIRPSERYVAGDDGPYPKLELTVGIKNTGTEVYDCVATLKNAQNDVLVIGDIKNVWNNESEYQLCEDGGIFCTQGDIVELRFNIRSGEPVVLKYVWDAENEKFRQSQTWKDVIHAIFEEQMQSMEPKPHSAV